MDVPQLDLRVFHMGEAGRARFADRLGQAFEDIGFATIMGHPIVPAIIALAYAMAAKLFAVPESVLQKYETPENGRQTGYTSFGVEHAKDKPDQADLKQHWNIRRALPTSHPDYLRNLWPTECLEFEKIAMAVFGHLDRMSLDLLTAVEIFMDYEPGTLTGMVRDGKTLMRVLHYPPVEGTPKAIRSGAHEDINLLTLLIAGTQPGLEVKTRDGRWVAVAEEPGSIVVNVADMLQMFTGGRLKSTTHRVVNPPGNANVSRYSWPFFVHPRGEVVLHAQTGYTAAMYLRRRLWEIGLLHCDEEPLAPPTF